MMHFAYALNNNNSVKNIISITLLLIHLFCRNEEMKEKKIKFKVTIKLWLLSTFNILH